MSDNKIDVLILDDSNMALSSMKNLLEGSGLDVVYESDPKKALEVIKDKLPKVIFVDYLMPELTGSDVAIKFSEMKLFKHCSINLLSGKDFNQNEIFSLMSLGYENILKKPVESDVFFGILEEHFPGLAKKAA